MEKGVWRTIGGRRVFIKDGQGLYEAMRESGKFKNIKEKQEQKEKQVQSVRDFKRRLKELENYNEELEIGNDVIIRTNDTYAVKRKGMESDPYTDYDPYTYGVRAKWLVDRYKNQGLLRDEDTEEIKTKPEQTIYHARGETKNSFIKNTVKQEENKDYEYKDSYKSYREKFNELWGEDGSKSKEVRGSYFTNDEFMEHLEDANWHTERRRLLEAKLTEKQMEYVKNNTNVDVWSADLNKEKTERLIKEAKEKYPSYNNEGTRYSVTGNSIAKYNNLFTEYKRLHPNTKMNLQQFAKMMMDLD